MTREDIVARVRRLEELALGLAREIATWRKAEDPLLYLERKAYLSSLGDVLEGIEKARVVLAKARIRMDGEM